mmetsp:Transcript_60923/g.108202  ORF Transcript_60923/g.108202 Transcript_60923/m.108202 type:complete len:841 (+) Transcript_60923:38-2560(+)
MNGTPSSPKSFPGEISGHAASAEASVTLGDSVSQAFQLIQYGSDSVELQPRELGCLMCILGIKGVESAIVYSRLTDPEAGTNVQELVNALVTTGLRSPDEIVSSLRNISIFQKAFKAADVDGSGTITKDELIRMLERLNIDRGGAADMLTHLDVDGSGEISWFEFIEGTTSEDFQKRFPEVTLESLAMLPSVLQDVEIDEEEAKKVEAELPSVERYMLRGLKAFMNSDAKSGRRKSIEEKDTEVIRNFSRMQTDHEKPHLLSTAKRRAMWICIYMTVLAGAGAGVIAALLAEVMNNLAESVISAEEDMIGYTCVAGVFSLAWSAFEIIVCALAATVGTAKIVVLCGLRLSPVNSERALLLGSVVRSALELGHPQETYYGVNPQKKNNMLFVVCFALAFMSARGVVKFVGKIFVKKVLPRALMKSIPTDAAMLFIEILVNASFNFFTLRACMLEVMICCLGPSASLEVSSKLIRERSRRAEAMGAKSKLASDQSKLLALRAVGVSVTEKKLMHPNNRYLLGHLAQLFAEKGFVDRVTIASRFSQIEGSQLMTTSEPSEEDAASAMIENETWETHIEPPLVFFPPQMAKGKLNPSVPHVVLSVQDMNVSGLLMPPLETAAEIGELLNLCIGNSPASNANRLLEALPVADSKEVPLERLGADAKPVTSASRQSGDRQSLKSYCFEEDDSAEYDPVEEETTSGCLCWKKKEKKIRLVDKMNARLTPLQLDNDEEFFRTLSLVREPDCTFVLSFLVLSLVIDGRVGNRDWKLLKKACAACNPPRDPSWSGLQMITACFVNGDEIGIPLFAYVLEGGSVDDFWSWRTIRASASLRTRKTLNALNIF